MTVYKGPNVFSDGKLKLPKQPTLITPRQLTSGVYKSDAPAFNNRFPKSRYKDQSGGQGGAALVASGGGGGDYLAKADFVNGVYTIDGNDVDITDILSTTPVLGADGLQLRTGGIVQQLKGDFLALLLAPMTVLIEVDAINSVTPDTTGINPTFLCLNDVTDSVELPSITAQSDPNGVNPTASVSDYDNNWSYNSDNVPIIIGSTSKVAFTLDGAHQAFSANGSTAQSDDTVPTPTDPVSTRGLIGYFNTTHIMVAKNECNIRAITIFAPLADGDLSALTTP